MKSLSFAADSKSNPITIAVVIREIILSQPQARARPDYRAMSASIEDKLDKARDHVVLTDQEHEMLLRVGSEMQVHPTLSRHLNRTLVALDNATEAIAKKG